MLSRVHIVLVRPRRPANVAAACRAMKNMGLGSLRLVDPMPSLEPPEVRALAYGAWDVLDAARHVPTLEAAVGDATLVAGTSGRADPLALTPRQLAERWAAEAERGKLALVFGPEASGLTNAELALLPTRVHIPCDASQSSLNLAQAVLLLAYELRTAAIPDRPTAPQTLATNEEVEAALAALREGLLAIGYLNPGSPDRILAELRRLVMRARPTAREVQLLQGLARQIRWAGGRCELGGTEKAASE